MQIGLWLRPKRRPGKTIGTSLSQLWTMEDFWFISSAWTAAATRTPTKALEDMVKERPAIVAFPGRLAVQGGLPILHQGECVGAVGVSGVKSHEDEQIAKAGLQALT